MSAESKSPGARARSDSLALRVASAATLAPAALAALFIGGQVFAAVVAFAAMVMIFEWARMVEGRDFSRAFYGLAIAAVFAFAFAAAGRFEAAYAACAAGALAAGLGSRFFGARRMRWAAFGAIYILAPAVALIWLRADPERGLSLTLILFAIVWSADTGGYLAGRLVGGPKMSPVVSPAKTWAGAAGGLLLGALAGFVAGEWRFGAGPFFALAGGCLGVASIVGDMAESAFKRHFGVKDASGLIPGHGGFLDRLDGMIFATAAMTLVLYLHNLLGRFQG